ncbi:hypothetical protein Cob_v004117 [Colletotrichum orbiculare MAFF 240422]|uniref:Uncharacterized protein n=1 Tax=Colletotrichum orbiculare (strain 104-T / ATCC 96160 / CBS 514.97 / LARS 414 / MAFF 240422) TaxID=1213857 RepID=A0A484FYE6_COLOR|nr:hypothetical protein Cob_v004117 [Colletotrichum orbiculare MAFF 240422]
MCQVFIYKHEACNCIWGEIAVPCGPGMGYTKCSQFGDGIAKEPLRLQMANLRPCPQHGLYGLPRQKSARAKQRRGFTPAAQAQGLVYSYWQR